MATATETERPRVRFSLRWKITLPFMLLALAIGLAATYVASSFLLTTAQDRYLRQLADSGQQATDGLVRIEGSLLEVERLIANTEGVSTSLVARDAEGMRQLVLPIVVNADVDLVAVLDSDGVSLLTVRRRPGGQPGEYETLRGEAYYADWESVTALLQGGVEAEKRAGLETLQLGPDGTTGALVVSGQVPGPGGRGLGVVVVGDYLDGVVEVLGQQAAANVSAYDLLGARLASTLESDTPEALSIPMEEQQALAQDPDASPVRRIQVSGISYGEILTLLTARGGEDILGVLGVSLIETGAASGIAGPDPMAVVLMSALALLLVVVVGLLISNSITRPLVRMADASSAVSTGHLDTRVPEGGGDEIGVLATTFNRMVEGLQEGVIYHDLLGRAVAPEVRAELRRSMAQGARVASVQTARATVLIAGLGGVFGADGPPTKSMESLSEYFAALVPLIAHHGGVVYRFEAEAAIALFGLLPRPTPAPVGALQASHAACELLDLVARLNLRGLEVDLPAMKIGVAVATGEVVAGGLGTRDRVQYTVIGEAMNAAAQIERILRDSGSDGVVLNGEAHHALGGARAHFTFGRSGQTRVPGRVEPFTIHEVKGRTRRLLESGGADFFDETTAPLV